MSARDYALWELDRKRLPGWRPGLFRHRVAPPADERDRDLAERIVAGVVKNHLHLLMLMAHWSGRSLKSIDILAQKILAIGLYQLRFLDRVPAPAAVYETVELARRAGRRRADGFINAVLRNALSKPPPALPDRSADPAGYARLVLSHPPELFERLAGEYGIATALRLAEHNQQEPPTVVRLYRGARAEDLAAEGVSVIPHRQPGMVVVQGARKGLLGAWAERGLAQVQDPTSARAAAALDIRSGQRVLDRCCGAGTKTFQICEMLGETGSIVAVDRSADRCALLREMLKRRGISNVAVVNADMLAGAEGIGPESFDRILIDAPCSNSGVLARRPEARYTQSQRNIASLAKLQDRILDDTAPLLRPGGLLLYSTCSLWPEENHRRIESFIRRHTRYRVLWQLDITPSLDADATDYHDGGYMALLTA